MYKNNHANWQLLHHIFAYIYYIIIKIFARRPHHLSFQTFLLYPNFNKYHRIMCSSAQELEMSLVRKVWLGLVSFLFEVLTLCPRYSVRQSYLIGPRDFYHKSDCWSIQIAIQFNSVHFIEQLGALKGQRYDCM